MRLYYKLFIKLREYIQFQYIRKMHVLSYYMHCSPAKISRPHLKQLYLIINKVHKEFWNILLVSNLVGISLIKVFLPNNWIFKKIAILKNCTKFSHLLITCLKLFYIPFLYLVRKISFRTHSERSTQRLTSKHCLAPSDSSGCTRWTLLGVYDWLSHFQSPLISLLGK